MNLRDAIRKIASEEFAGSKNKVAIVLSVSGSTCDVRILDTEYELTGVRLQASEASGMLYKPAIDSVVIISAIDDFEYVVIMYSEIEEITFLDGSYGGLTKTQELKAQLDKTNEVVQTIVDALKNWTVVSSDGGAALKTYFTTLLGAKVIGDFSDIENDKITHGTV